MLNAVILVAHSAFIAIPTYLGETELLACPSIERVVSKSQGDYYRSPLVEITHCNFVLERCYITRTELPFEKVREIILDECG